MGNCLTHFKAELLSPPPNAGNWENLSPRNVILLEPQEIQIRPRSTRGSEVMRNEKTKRVTLARRETPSGIEGLTFDHAGRPVWRDPKLQTPNPSFQQQSTIATSIPPQKRRDQQAKRCDLNLN